MLRRNLLSRVRMFFYSPAPRWPSRSGTCCTRCRSAEIGERIVHGHGPGHDRVVALRASFVTSPDVKSGYIGPADAGHGAEAGARPRARPRSATRARTSRRATGATRSDAPSASTTKASSAPATPCCWIDDHEPAPGPAVRRPHRRGLQAGHRHLRQRRAAAREDHRRGRPVRAGRGDHRPQPQRGRRAGLPAAVPCASCAGLPRRRAAERSAGKPPAVQAHFQDVLDALAAQATGSASRVARLHLMHEPPSIDKGEVTDKGSINQRAVLKHRDALVRGLARRPAAVTLISRSEGRMNIQGQPPSSPAAPRPRRSHGAHWRAGAKVAVLDVNFSRWMDESSLLFLHQLRHHQPDGASRSPTAHARILMNIAGIGTPSAWCRRTAARAAEDFAASSTSTYRHLQRQPPVRRRLREAAPLEDGERGVMLFTARSPPSTARWPAGLQRLQGRAGRHDLPMARDLAQHGIRVCTIAPACSPRR